VHSRPLIELIKQAKITRIDLLKVEVSEGTKTRIRYAHSYIGMGLTPVVAAELNKTTLNALKEAWIVIKTFIKFRPFKLIIDDKVTKLDSIIFANIGQMAKILTLSTAAKIDDGRFEVIILPHASKLRLVTLFSKAAFTGLKPKKYQSFEFSLIKKIPVQFDGEVVFFNARSHVKVTAEKKILKSIV
jgi:diacylglycerol kinase family enzyme